jgi:hypothetical protein
MTILELVEDLKLRGEEKEGDDKIKLKRWLNKEKVE